MSQIVAFCPSCQKKYKIDTSLLGRVLKCKACETLFEIAKPPETVVPTTPAQPAPAPAPDPLAMDPLAVDPLAVDPLAVDPMAVDPMAVDPLSVDPLAVDPLAIDPLAPGPQSQAPAAAPIPAAAPAPAAAAAGAGWQKAVSEHKKKQPLGGNERALLLLGGFLLVFGLAMNLLPLFGMQVARMQGTGKMGQIVGLLMGLAGAGMLAGGLRNFRMAAIISGAAGGGFLLVVFLVSLLAGREPDVAPLLVDGGPGGGDQSYDINNVSSPWKPTYGDWEGFSSQLRRGTATAQWRRVSSRVDGVSASFFGALQASREKISIEGQEVSSEIIQSRSGQQVFELVTFEYPDSDAEDTVMLDAVESTIRNISRSKPVTIESFPAREYTARGASRGRHGVIVVAGTTVIIARVSGPPAHVPGENSRKFTGSLQIDPGVATGNVSTENYEGDMIDPFTFDGSGGNETAPPPTGATTTTVQLSSADRQHDKKIQDHMRALQGAMEEHINLRVQINFNSQYLSVSAGEDTRNPRYIAHPGKVPVTGIDFVVTRSGDSHAFTNLTPVYDTAKTDCVVKARPGYGLSGLRVNARSHVEGIKFVFSKVTDRGFDESQSYESDWYGTPASGSGQVVDSGGSPVYGLWMCKRNVISSLGLIREK